jgi:hypothetical protein
MLHFAIELIGNNRLLQSLQFFEGDLGDRPHFLLPGQADHCVLSMEKGAWVDDGLAL